MCNSTAYIPEKIAAAVSSRERVFLVFFDISINTDVHRTGMGTIFRKGAVGSEGEEIEDSSIPSKTSETKITSQAIPDIS